MTTRFIGRDNVRKRLEALEGTAGTTIYADGAVRIESESERLLVRPSFGMGHTGSYETVHVEPLLDEIARDHLVAVVLVRLGGYAVGVFEGEALQVSKVDSRFVKNRHKQGGSSANRFRRRRGEQAKALIEEAAEVTARVLTPWQGQARWAALGGDRGAIDLVLAEKRELAWLRERSLPRFFTVEEPRRRVLDALPYALYAVEVSSLPRP